MVKALPMAAIDDPASVAGALAHARRRLTAAGIGSVRLDAELLLAHVLRSSRERLHTHPERSLSPMQRRGFERLVARRVSRVPVAYLTGVKEFYGHTLRVTPRVLIPRAETELLVELAIAFLRRRRAARNVIDLGTGSGAIAIAVASAVRRVRVLAVDIDASALGVAAGNVRSHRLAERVQVKRADLLVDAPPADLIIANLPYLSAGQRRVGQPELGYEPARALDGGRDGMALTRRALSQVPGVLKPSGCLLMELDPAQALRLRRLAARTWPAAEVSLHKDLSGRVRALQVVLP